MVRPIKSRKSQQSQSEEIKIELSILRSATLGNSDSIKKMFRQFITEDENIIDVKYLGLQGLWGIGTHSFVCLTQRRVADITVAHFGEVTYQDGYLEDINSSFIYQPSKLGLYLSIGFLALISFGIALLFLPFLVKGYYATVKCGIVFAIKEGIAIYIFSDRRYLRRVNEIARKITLAREERVRWIKKMHT